MKTKMLFKAIVACLVLMTFLISDSCEYFQDEDNNPEPDTTRIAKFFPLTVPGYNDFTFVEKPIKSYIGEFLVPGGYAIKEWLEPGGTSFLISIIFDYIEKSESEAIFSKYDTLPNFQPYLFADNALIGGDKNRTGLVGTRLLVFTRNEYLILVGTGTLDSTLQSPDSSLLVEIATSIDNSILGSSGPKKYVAGVASSPSTRIKSIDENTNQEEILSGEKPLQVDISMGDKTVGYIKFMLKSGNPVPGVCVEPCLLHGGEKHCQHQAVEVCITTIYLNEEGDDTDNWPLVDWTGEAVVGTNFTIIYNCMGQNKQQLPWVSGELGTITENTTLSLNKCIAESQFIECQCIYQKIYLQGRCWLYDSDTNGLTDCVIKLHEVLKDNLVIPKEISTAVAILTFLNDFTKPLPELFLPAVVAALKKRGEEIGSGSILDPVEFP